jgi:hypothetical protein
MIWREKCPGAKIGARHLGMGDCFNANQLFYASFVLHSGARQRRGARWTLDGTQGEEMKT